VNRAKVVDKMGDETGPVEQPITTGEWIRGLLFILIPMAVVALVIWMLVSFVLPCGCLTRA
jgi:hypothetical protein